MEPRAKRSVFARQKWALMFPEKIILYLQDLWMRESSKVTTVDVKTKSLTKASVKNSLKGSKVKTVRVKIGNKKTNKSYVKKYKKIFTKKNAGRKVTVK